MQANATPFYDASDNPTACCPRFNPDGWDDQELHFDDKLFVRADTRSLFHIPLNMGPVFEHTFKAIEAAGALDAEHMIVLSYDPSPWHSEHYFSVTREVPGQQMVTLSGDYVTRVFEGPYRNMRKWLQAMQQSAKDRGRKIDRQYFFYTTCPKCAKTYGKNYVVGVARLA